MSSLIYVSLQATGPIFFAIADFEGRCGDLVRCGGLHFVTALFAIIEPFIRGYRYSCSSAVNPSGELSVAYDTLTVR